MVSRLAHKRMLHHQRLPNLVAHTNTHRAITEGNRRSSRNSKVTEQCCLTGHHARLTSAKKQLHTSPATTLVMKTRSCCVQTCFALEYCCIALLPMYTSKHLTMYVASDDTVANDALYEKLLITINVHSWSAFNWHPKHLPEQHVMNKHGSF